MKQYLFIFLFSFFFGALAQSQDTHWPLTGKIYEFENDTVTYVFDRLGSIYSTPHSHNKALDNKTDSLKWGTEVILLKKDKEVMELAGVHANWFQVSYHKDGIKKTGYIWGGELSLRAMRRGNVKFLYGIKRIDTDIPNPTSLCSIRVLSNDSLIDYKEFMVPPESVWFSGAQIYTSKGLSNVQNLINVVFTGSACAIPTHKRFFTWNGTNLQELPLLTDVSDAGAYSHEENYIFPSEKGGIKNTITLVIKDEDETGKFDKAGNPIVKKKKQVKYYKWDGTKAIAAAAK